MKKYIFFFLIFVSSILFAQNPDGTNASLHVTPLWLWGNSQYSRSTSIWYPPTQASDEQSVVTNNYGIIKYPTAFGVNTMLKIPTTSFLTLCISYSYNQKFDQYIQNEFQGKYFSQYWHSNGKLHAISFTVSVYNLFSLYLE